MEQRITTTHREHIGKQMHEDKEKGQYRIEWGH